MLKTKFKNNIKYILINNENTTLISNNIINISIGLNKLKDKFDLFFNSKNLKIIIGNNYKENGYTYFLNEYIFENEEYIIFYDITLFYLIGKNKLESSKKNKIIGFLFNKELFLFSFDKFEYIYNYFSNSLPNDLYDILHNNIKNQNEIYINKNLILNNSNLISNFLSKDINFKDDYLVKINKKSQENIDLVNFFERFNIDKEIFTNSGYNYSKKITIKTDTGYLLPISSTFKFLPNHLNIIFGYGYGAIYNINMSDRLFISDALMYSSGFHKNNKKIAQIKGFAEGIERFNSGFFEQDNIGLEKLDNLNINLSEKILGFSINTKYKSLHYGNIYKIKSNFENIIREKYKIKIPYNILYYPIIKGEETFYYSSSNGVSAGRNYEEAIMGGIFELLERDSIALTWLLKLTPPIINKNTLPSKIQNYVNYIEQKGNCELFIFDISYDKNNPHILIMRKYENDKISVGASSGLSLEEVILKALDEISTTCFYFVREIKKINNYTDIKSVADHIYFYCQNGNLKYLYFLFSKNEIIDFNVLNKKFNHKLSIGGLLGNLEKNIGGNFYLSDLTTKYSQKIGIYVIRILSENLIPIWFGNFNQVPKEKKRLKNPVFNKWKKHKYKYDIPDFLHFFD